MGFNGSYGGFSGIGSGANTGRPVTDTAVQTLLLASASWGSNGAYIGAAITGIDEGSWYQTPDTGSNTRYWFFFKAENDPIRIPFTNVLLNE